MAERLRERAFAAIVTVGARRPWLVLGIVAVLCVIGGVIGTGLQIQTSRYSMVRADDPNQQRLDRFFARFGYPDPQLFVISGGAQADRRAVVDALRTRIDDDPPFHERVLARIDVEAVAETLILQDPGALAQLRASLPPDVDFPSVVEGGIPGWLGAIEAQLAAGLDGPTGAEEGGDETGGDGTQGDGAAGDGRDGAAPAPAPERPDPKQVDEGLRRLATMATLLDEALAGRPSGEMFAELRARADEGGQGAAAPNALKNVDSHGYLTVGGEDVLLVAVFARLDDATSATYERVVTALRSHRDAVLREVDAPDVEVRLTGIPALTIDENVLVAQGMRDSGLATFAAVFLVLLVAYWSLRQAIFALLPLGLGMGIAVGAITLVVGSLNTITSAMFAMLLGLGIDFSVHLLARYQEVAKDLPDQPTEALRRAFAQAGPGVVTGAFTTIVAFLALLGAEFTTFAELGLNTAIGLAILMVVTVVVLPPLQTLRRRAPRVSGGVTGLRFLHGLVKRGAGLIVAIAVAATGFGIWAALNLGFNARYFDFLPQRVESAVALDVLERSGGLSPVIAYAVGEDLEDARRMTEALRALEPVGDVQSPTDLLPPLDETRKRDLRAAFTGLSRDPDFKRLEARPDRDAKIAATKARDVADLLGETLFAMEQGGLDTKAATEARDAFRRLEQRLVRLDEGGGGEAAITRVETGFAKLLARAWRVARDVERRGAYDFDDIPPVFRHRHRAIADDDPGVALFVSPRHRIWDEGQAERFALAVETIAPDAAGHAINMHVHNQMILRDFRQAAMLAAFLVAVLVFIDFRRVDETLLSLVPVLMGLTWTFAVMWLTGADLNVANIVVLPLVIGIGVDAGVHVMHRWHQSAAEHGGVAIMKDIVEGTGGAVMVASVTTMLGFAGMLIPDHGGIRSLGYVMVVGVACSLSVTLVVLPSLLVLLRRIR